MVGLGGVDVPGPGDEGVPEVEESVGVVLDVRGGGVGPGFGDGEAGQPDEGGVQGTVARPGREGVTLVDSTCRYRAEW